MNMQLQNGMVIRGEKQTGCYIQENRESNLEWSSSGSDV